MAATTSDASTLIERGVEDRLFLFDRRLGKDSHETCLPFNELKTLQAFRERIKEVLHLEDEFVISTTSREVIRTEDDWSHIEGGDTLYVLSSIDQSLEAQTQERVNYLPHYDTIVKGGMYEYYASEGHNPLPYAFAELIDNSLAATAENTGSRKIEIRLHLDESNPARNVIFVVDNGKGMTSRQLNNWAVYRLSKFIRNKRRGQLPDGENEESSLSEKNKDAPRSLNSDISYFGVGGKQAIFFIGSSCRMISKSSMSRDVHELVISKEEFEEKEKNKEAIYSGYIRNRQARDVSHVSAEDEILKQMIGEESEEGSFTTVVINNISPTHIPYLKANLEQWTRQLAHIYHYYLHGPNGNLETDFPTQGTDELLIRDESFSNLQIEVKLFLSPAKAPLEVNLRDINDDMQTQYIRTSSSTFEFKAVVEGTGIVEGVIRYHPFLYDRETYPSDANDMRAEPDPEDDHDYTQSDVRPARGKRPIFECFWNGRLIPYTYIEELDWCNVPKKSKTLPLDCFNRISGVLWTNDKFQVSTNKLTFIDLEVKLREKHTTYSRILGRNEKRTDISKEFQTWLKGCHEQCDKQVKFSKFVGPLVRTDVPKYKQSPWATYKQIEWGNKVFKQGDLVRITKTLPYFYGTIQRFILYGAHEGDVFATGGELELVQEPKSLYDEVRIVPLNKLDRVVDTRVVGQAVEEEENKLPDKLLVAFPEGCAVIEGEKRPAGKTIGDIKVEIANRKGELISKLPGPSQKKLLVELRVLWHASSGDETVIHHISQHGKTWPYWFKRIVGVIKNLGKYTLQLQTIVNESGVNTFAGKPLPFHKLNFTVTEAAPEKFSIGVLDGPLRIGEPFNLPLQFQDEFGHVTSPSIDFKPVIKSSELEVTFGDIVVKGNSLVMKGITAKGSIPPGQGTTGMSFDLSVTVEGLEKNSETFKIRMLPGNPHKMDIFPKEPEVENGKEVKLTIEVRDVCDNMCYQPKLVVNCKIPGVSGLPTYHVDCSHSGEGVLTAGPIELDTVKKSSSVTANLDIQGNKSMAPVQCKIKVLPSSRASHMELYYTKNGKTVPVKGDLSAVSGSHIDGITFKVIDEGGHEKLVDDTLASKIKVNWVPKLKDYSLIKNGCLPKIKVPLSVSETKYCSVSVNDGSGVEISFNVKGLPGEPAKIKCKLRGETQVRMGEILKGDVVVGVTDAHGNDIKKFEKGVLNDLHVSAEGLVEEDVIRALGQTSGFLVSGLKFDPGTLGGREVHIKWGDLEDYVRVEVLAGPPSQLKLVGYDHKQPLTIYNHHSLPKPLIVQLVDEYGNDATNTNMNYRIQLAKQTGLRLIPAPEPLKIDKTGKVDFGNLEVSGKMGVFELQPKAFLGRTTLSGPKLKISIQPDATKPTKLELLYDKGRKYVVGEIFPAFTVTVYSEDNVVMETASAAAISMKLVKQDASRKRPISFVPDQKRKNDTAGVFMFSKARIPEESGHYLLWFEYSDGKHEVKHEVIDIEIEPGQPVFLETRTSVGTPTVSNISKQACRVLLSNLSLELKDKYQNQAGQDVTGKVLLELLSGAPGISEIPCFVGNTRKLHLSLTKGKASFSSLVLQENCPGKDGTEYILRLTVESSDIPKNHQIPALEIPFLFYNDSKKQSQSAALSKERDNLTSAIRTYKSLFDTTQQLIEELKISFKEAQSEENRLKSDLRKSGILASHLANVHAVETEIQTLTTQKEQLMKVQRRMCGLQPAPDENDVLGKIAHLAQIGDCSIARVLSWHMSADMDCVVTLSTKKAKDIYSITNGKQQVLPLDSIFKKNLPDWNKPLPHERIKQGWLPTGNPMYARNCMHFSKDEDNCRVVFGMLLGDTIILDTLDDANAYRQEIVKHTHCPTILTREGDRIRSNGKFGGLMNKALPIEKLRGAVFSEPLPARHSTLCSQIDTLQSYILAIEKRQQAECDLKDQLEIQKNPEMRAKQREFEEAQQQLQEIEARLGLNTPGQKRKTLHETPDVSPELPTKRSRSATSTPASSTNRNTPPQSPRGSGGGLSTRHGSRRAGEIPTKREVEGSSARKRTRRT